MLIRTIFVFITGFLLVPAALASALQVTPTRLDLSAKEPIATLNLSNKDTVPVTMQARLMAWTQKEGEDSYEKTNELIITPPIVTIAPNQKQLIRVAARHLNQTNHELAYRLYLKELPPPSKPGTKSVMVLSEISMPLFIAPNNSPVESFSWTAKALSNQKIQVRLTNTGNVHTQIAHLKVMQPNLKNPLFDQEMLGYVLPGQFKQWAFPASSHKPVHIVALAEKGEQHWDIQINS